MRENKCRAWDTKWHRWILPRDIVLYGGEWYFDRRAEAEGDIIECTGLEEVILEWFTGIKDKNGVEIYDGDIVNAKPLLLGTSRGKVVRVDKIAGFGVEMLTGIWTMDGIEEIEVIGNIHENKDLL